ncbi:MAG TPA: MBG domain-containing protein, partial [Puia sp.]
ASRLTTQPTLTTTAAISSPVGTYPITASGALSANYTISYNGGTMTVQRATLTVTPNPVTFTYGGTLPGLTATYTGFVNGDNVAGLTSSPSISTTATASSPAGTYSITSAGGSSSNYNFVYNTGTLTINPAAIHVTAQTATKAFGTPDPTFNYTVSGLVNGDNPSVFTGSLSRAAGENVGAYPITLGSLSAGGNYTIGYTGSNFTITIASQQISWSQSLIVGCSNQTQVQLTATASSGLPVTYTVADGNIAGISGNVLTLLQPGTTIVTATQAGDANHTAATPVADTIFYQAASLIRQRWSDAIFFDNTSGDYVEWQWYKNGDAVSGATSPYFSESPSLNGQYYVVATNKDSQRVQSCILSIAPGTAIPGGMKLFPNPAAAGSMVTVTSNYTSVALQGAILQIVDLSGKVRLQMTTVQPTMQVTMPSETGTYIVNLLLASGQKSSLNVLVVQ